VAMRAPETEEDLHDDGGYNAEHHTEPVRDQPPRHAEDRPQRQADTPEQMRMSLKATSARKADDSRNWKPAKDTITPRRPGVVPSSAPETAAMGVHRLTIVRRRDDVRERRARTTPVRVRARAAADTVGRLSPHAVRYRTPTRGLTAA
jgi:hypothetical protein